MNKKVSVVLLVFLLAIPVVFAKISVERTSVETTEEDVPINVEVKIDPDNYVSGFDLYEFSPKGWDVVSWNVQGYEKANIDYEVEDKIYQGKERTSNHWRLTKTFKNTITLSYQVLPLDGTGTHEFLTVWTYPGGYNNKITKISVLPSSKTLTTYCGNDVCDLGETYSNCPEDCEKEGKTGTAFVPPNVTINLTPIILFTVVLSFSFAAFLIYEKMKKSRDVSSKQKEVEFGEKIAIEDLRTFIKLGLRRGYTLRQMANALKGSQIDTRPFKEIAEDELLKDMNRRAELRKRAITKDDKYIRKLKKIIKRLKEKQ